MKRLILASLLACGCASLIAKDITWSGGNWNLADASWTDGAGGAVKYENGDNVRFAMGGSVTLTASVSPGDVVFDIPAGETLKLAINGGCLIGSATTSFRKTGGGTLEIVPANNSNSTGIGVTCGVVIEEGVVALTKANAIIAYNQSAANWWTVKSGAALHVLARNVVGNVANNGTAGGNPQTFNLRVESGGTLRLRNGDGGGHCGNTFKSLVLEGGALLDIPSADAAGVDGLIHIGSLFCVTGSVPVTVAFNSGQRFCLNWDTDPVVFDVADVTGDDEADLIMNTQFCHHNVGNVAGFVKKGAGRMQMGANVTTDASYEPNGDISVMEGVLEYTLQAQLNGMHDRTVYVGTNATLHYAMRNIQNGNNFDVAGFNLKIVVDHGTFLLSDPADENGHNYLGKELTLIDGVLTNAMNGFSNQKNALQLMTLGKRLTLKGGTPYVFEPYRTSCQSVHLWGTNTTEFVVDDITGDDATDATIHWTLIDRYNTSTSDPRTERSGLVKSGAGTLCLTSRSNTFSGDVEVREGTLLLDWPEGKTEFGQNEQTILGNLTDASRTVTVYTNGTLALGQRNILTYYGYGAKGNNRLATPVALKGGTLKVNGSNGFGDLTVEDGRIAYDTSSGWGVLGVHGTFTVAGSTPCELPAKGSSPHMFLYPDAPTVFDVADVTGDARADLVMGLQLIMPPDPAVVNYFRTNFSQTAYGFVKQGAGTMALNIPNRTSTAFNGDATVNAGVLEVNGDLRASDTVRVAAGAFLGGTGTVNKVALAAGAGFAAADGQEQPLTVLGDLALPETGVVRLSTASGSTPPPAASRALAALVEVSGTLTCPDSLDGWTVLLDGVDMTRRGYKLVRDGKRLRAGRIIGTVIVFK